VERQEFQAHFNYAWRKMAASSRGRALQWWLDRLENAIVITPSCDPLKLAASYASCF
jgi:hypothetical protein